MTKRPMIPNEILDAIRQKVKGHEEEGYEVSATVIGPNGQEVPISMEELNPKKKSAKRAIPEAQIMELKDFYERYVGECPFKPGDIVTPRQNVGVNNTGIPYVVLEVIERDDPVFDIEHIGSAANGARLNVRVACFFSDEEISMFWHEHQLLEPYEI